MNNALQIIMQMYNFMKNTTLLSFDINGVSVSITCLQLALGVNICVIGINFIKRVFIE